MTQQPATVKLTEYMNIHFSRENRIKSPEEKIEVLSGLEAYFNDRSHIWTGWDEQEPISGIVDDYKKNPEWLSFDPNIISAELTPHEIKEVRALGFDVRRNTGIAFTGG